MIDSDASKENPSKMQITVIMKNGVRISLNILAIGILIVLIVLNVIISLARLDPYAFVSTDEIITLNLIHNSANFLCALLSAWLGWNAYLAHRLGQRHWMWIFGVFAVAFLPFLSFKFGLLWILIDIILIVVLAASCFLFKVPLELPPDPGGKNFGLSNANTLEENLNALRRLADSGLLTEDEYREQKRKLLGRDPVSETKTS